MKPKKCKYCNEPFVPQRPLQYLCGPHCAWKYTEKQKRDKAAKDWKVEKARLTEKLMTTTDYEKKLQVEINAIVRLIDAGCTCISCGNLKRAFAGHFHSTGANKSITFHLDNIHIQDFNCNGERGGNVVKYGQGLIAWYGKEYKEYVEYNLVRLYPSMKWSKEDLTEWTRKAREIRKDLEKINLQYSAANRMRLRKKYNKMLGIYN